MSSPHSPSPWHGNIPAAGTLLLLLCCAVGQAVVVAPAGAAVTTPPPAVSPTPSPAVDRREIEEREQRLAALLEKIEARQAELKNKEALLRRAREEGQRTEIEAQIESLRAEIQKLEESFREVAAGVGVQELAAPPKGKLDIVAELKELLEPLVNEIKQATTRPRQMDRLGRQMSSLRERLDLAERAVANVAQLRAAATSRGLRERLQGVERIWSRKAEHLGTELEIAGRQLEQLRAGRTPVYEALGQVFRMFFRSRGRNLVFAILAFAIAWAVLAFLHAAVRRLSPVHRPVRSPAGRAFDLLYTLFEVLAATAAFLLVLYITGDWVLLSIATLFLLGLAWASKTAVPRFWRQAMLLLNFGSVREGERILYNGVPYRVDALGFHTILNNPDLAGGRLRLPLRLIEELQSRPFQKDEPWFPTRRGDWVLLEDGKHGHVVIQTPEVVTVIELGGARRSFRAGDFFSRPPTVLSAGFRLWVTFGVDYQHQGIATTRIPAILEERLRRELSAANYGEHLVHLVVEFKEAGASSLDVVVMADFRGSAAPDYQKLRRLVQRACVDACNENSWVIPFTQLTLHVAALPGPHPAGEG